MSIPRVQRVQEDGTWTVALPGVPLAISGGSLHTAVDGMVEALRDYAADWHAFLSIQPGHQDNKDLVRMIDTCPDVRIRAWLMGMKP